MRPESVFQIASNWSKIGKMTMTSQLADMTSSSSFICRCFVFLVKISYWSKFHVNVITGSGVMTIFFYKGLTRNPEIGHIPVWVLPNIWGQERVSDTKFGTNVSNEMLPNFAKCQLRHLSLLSYQGKTNREGKITPPLPPSHPPRLGLSLLFAL